MTERPLAAVDIDAVSKAVDALDEADVQVLDIEGIDRVQTEDGKVRWTMTVEADARTQSLADYGLGEADD